MRTSRIAIALLLSGSVAGVQAAGPLFLTPGENPVPLRWNTGNGPIPVWTDGGEAFTFDFDGVTPFITIERADELTQHALDQWNSVPTSTFEAQIAGTIDSQAGVADVTGANAGDFIGVENGYGFWVLYDTDGSIMEDYFGISRYAVLGIAFPEWSEGEEIVESTVILNGWLVSDQDTEGNFISGVFTHEFGHAINLSHSQTNGHLAQISAPWQPLYAGVPGCVDPTFSANWEWFAPPGSQFAPPSVTEVMFPFIDSFSEAGQLQGILEQPDDAAAISDLYPTPDYFATRGSITGVLRLKDGRTEYSGINVIARNINNPLGDAVSGMTGALTQGQVGPDGRFVINNLTPGEQYVVYIEEIVSGGYPTAPQFLVSVPEYWNDRESRDPLTDNPCHYTPIVAQAGVTRQADITFNGFDKGIEFWPLVNAFATDLSKNGRTVAGGAQGTAFLWNASQGFTILPPEFISPPAGGQMDRNGHRLLVEKDFNGNGLLEAGVWTRNGAIRIGDLNGNSCGLGSEFGVSASTPWAISDDGRTVVGLAARDLDGDGNCVGSFNGELAPFIWTERRGIRPLDTSTIDWNMVQFIRADVISGDGRVVLGNAGFTGAVAWINDGKLIDLTEKFGATRATAVNRDGTRVALSTFEGVKLWNATGDGSVRDIGGLKWCEDLPLVSFFGGDLCEEYGAEQVQEWFGPIPVEVTDMTDDGTVMIGRAGGFFTGFAGAIWFEGVGWMNIEEFFRVQGAIEAAVWPFQQPLAISGSGREIVGQPAPGVPLSFFVDLQQVHVCHKGKSQLVGFPGPMLSRVRQGAKIGRCEFLD
jgi:hypothetical protein